MGKFYWPRPRVPPPLGGIAWYPRYLDSWLRIVSPNGQVATLGGEVILGWGYFFKENVLFSVGGIPNELLNRASGAG